MSDVKLGQVPIAVVGVSALFPGSSDGAGFWTDILAGRDLVTDVPASHWLIEDYYDPDPTALDKTYSKRGAFLNRIDFDPMAFGVPPSIVPATDTAQLLALIVAQRVLDDASKGQFASMDRERISVLLGVTSAQELLGSMVSRLQKPVWLKALRESGIPEDEAQKVCERIASGYVPWQESSFPGLLGNVVAGRIANRFDLRGTNAVTDAACASSLAAMSMGINELVLGQSDLVITGGVDTMNDIFMYMCFSKTPALSPTGDCRPFSDEADGTLLGEGMAMVALKRLADAERDGDRIYSVIKGLGTSSDGRSKSVYAPLPEGQARALRRTYEAAGYPASTVELVEAHGTGTKAGDAAEFEGLKIAFEESDSTTKQWCALGSVKSQIGHTKAAAGAAGLFKAIMALHHKVLPPTIKVNRPNPKIAIEQSPFYLNTQSRPWIRDSAHPRRASVSSFGFGGSNFHVALEEYVPSTSGKSAWRYRSQPAELVLITGDSASEVADRCGALATSVESLADIARASQLGLNANAKVRLAIVANSKSDLADKLKQAASTVVNSPAKSFSTPNGVHFSPDCSKAGAVAFLFPGQGSQYVNMGADVAMFFDAARAVWDEAANTKFDGVPLHEVVFPLPAFSDEVRETQAKKLTQTEWAQPALGITSLAVARVLAEVGVKPEIVAGHSFGEVTALAVAGAFDESTLIQIARKRGELMRDAASISGAMIAVSKPIDEVRKLIAQFNADVVVANHNAPEQIVLSGATDAIAKLETELTNLGINVKRLPVATAFHSPLVAGSSKPFTSYLQTLPIAAPSVPVYANATAAPYANDAAEIAPKLGAQLASSVRFVEEIEAMYQQGVRLFVEVGAGGVLTELVGRILGDRPHTAIATDRKGRNGVTSLLEAMGRLVVSGLALDFAAHWQNFAPPAPPAKKPAMVIPLNGANHAKPYPPPGGAAELPAPNPARPHVAPQPVVASIAPAQAAIDSAPVVATEAQVAYRDMSAPVETAATSEPSATPNFVETRSFEVESVTMTSQAKSPANVASVVDAVNSPTSHVATTTVVAQPVMAPTVQYAWVNAYQEAQRQTADAHAAYQRAMAESHIAFLKTVESSFQGLAAMMTGGPVYSASVVPSPATLVAQAPVSQPVLAAPAAQPVALPASPAAVSAPVAQASVSHTPAYVAPSAALQVAPIVAAPVPPPPAPAPVAPATSAPAAPAVDLEALMLAVVAEKTGYPVDMLGAQMELEADLGIDSIKRVEILSAVRERAPGLPQVKASELASLRTLGQIIDHLRASLPNASGSSNTASAPVAPSASTAPVPATTAPPAIDLEALMLAVVAEKTGYPAEMLGAQMELEADLGIDSIKRVEILSAVRERAPGLPQVKASELASLRTLGQIIDHLRANLPSSNGGAPTTAAVAPVAPFAPAPVAATPAAPSAGSSAPSVENLEALMLAVVAEKTGYPAEMLGAQMELEADLGIDSIKRVEILSAVRERAPGLPQVKASELASLRTLGQIIDRLRAHDAPDTNAAKSPTNGNSASTTQSAPATPEKKILRFVVTEVESPNSGLCTTGLFNVDRVWVTQDGGGVAEALVEKLGAVGVRAAVTSTVPPDAKAVIFLGALRSSVSEQEAVAINREAFAVAKTVAPRFSTKGGLFVTVQNTGGDFGLSGSQPTNAWLGGVAALARTAALEWPEATVRAIDCDTTGRSAVDVANAISNELLTGGAALEVGLKRDGRRITVVSSPRDVDVSASNQLDRDAVVVASGGARGVTAAALIELARKRQPRIVLLGRTAIQDEPAALHGARDEASVKKALIEQARSGGKPVTPAEIAASTARVMANREVRSTLEAIKAAGSLVRYVAADVQDAASLSKALDQIRAEWGPITAVVHGAGVLADKRIEEKTQEQFDRVFDTKVKGLQALLNATANDPLKVLCLFSSVAARTGNLGQCDYAMANEILNAVACAEQQRRGQNCIVRSIGWGPWEGGMVTPSLKTHFEHMGVTLIPLSTGASMFVDELEGPTTGTSVVIGGANGSGALGAGEGPTVVAELRVNSKTFSHLSDHRIAGTVVVPMTVASDWMLRMVRAANPGLSCDVLRDLKVVRGIKLEHFDGEGELLSLRSKTVSVGGRTEAHVEIRGKGDAVHYSAIALLNAPASAPLQLAAATGRWSGQSIYDGHALFHGDTFRVIRSIEGISRDGIAATLVGSREMNWAAEPMVGDQALLDGALQLALVWAKQVLGSAFLPMGIGQLRIHHAGSITGSVRCILQVRQIKDAHAVVDISLVAGNQLPLADIVGLEIVQRPGEPAVRSATVPVLA